MCSSSLRRFSVLSTCSFCTKLLIHSNNYLHPNMASTSNNNSSRGSLCLDKCGFFASTEGRCSKCYRDWKAKQNNESHNTTTSTNTDSNAHGNVDANNQHHASNTAALLSPLTSPSLTASVSNSLQASPLLLPQQQDDSHKMDDLDVNLTSFNTNNECKQAENVALPSFTPSSTFTFTSAPTPSTDSTLSDTFTSPSKSSSKIRCVSCSKKLSAMSYFTCKCDSTLHFCATHRYPHAHQCSFDHKNQQKNNLQKSVFLVKDRQIEKI